MKVEYKPAVKRVVETVVEEEKITVEMNSHQAEAFLKFIGMTEGDPDPFSYEDYVAVKNAVNKSGYSFKFTDPYTGELISSIKVEKE